MRIFELHFNPRPKNESAEEIFDSFCYEPENTHEKRMGSLYAVGELRNLLPQNIHLLNNLSRVMKDKFYATSFQAPEKAFESCLKAANEFLAQEVSKENVSWLGNLNFAVLRLTLHHFAGKRILPKALRKKQWTIDFSKAGGIKIFLLSAKQIIDLGKDFDFEEIEPYPLKIFTKSLSGRISFGDKIMILTQGVYDFFSKKDLFNKFLEATILDEKKIREILKTDEEGTPEISGVLLLIDSMSEPLKRPKIVTFKKELEKFSMKEVFFPLLKILLKLNLAVRVLIDKITFKLQNIFSLPKIKIGRKGEKQRSLSSPIFKQKIKISDNLKKNLILIFLLIVLLLAGFFIFQLQEKQKLKEGEKILSEVQEKILKAENFLIFNNEEQSWTILKEAWEEILPLTKEEGPLKDKAVSLNDSIESNLKNISKLELVSDPEIVFEFDPKEFIPQKMVYSNGDLYFFSPLSNKLFKINPQNKNKNSYTFPSGNDKEVSLATNFGGAILFFSKPDKIVFFQGENFGQSFSLKLPYSDLNLVSFASYQGGIYFLDSKRGEIIKYLSPFEGGKDSPQFYLNSQTKKAADSKSMAINGSIWILKEDNIVSQYYNGRYQKDLSLEFFPFPKRLYKIFARPYLPYLYLLEPTQNRVIVLEKTGEVVKQFQSEKFDSLKDFTVSENGKTIWILNGLIIYQITL